MDALHKILKLISNKGIDQQDFAIQLGLHKRTITDWKSGKSKSYMKYIDKIADYFNVSTDYLLGKSDTPTLKKKEAAQEGQPMSDKQKKILSAFELLSEEDEDEVLRYVEYVKSKHNP